MTEAIALQLIIAVSQFCSISYRPQLMESIQFSQRTCYHQVWTCGHKTTDASVIAVETHNCIGKYLRGELK
jgi:hypothetical protein